MSIRSIGIKLASLLLRFDKRHRGNEEDYLKLARSWSFLGRAHIGLQQLDGEILQLLFLVKELHLRRLLEIGTAGGGTLYLLCKVAAADVVILSIDLQYGPFGGGYPSERRPLYASFARHQQKVLLLQADSHESDTLARAKNLIGRDSLDFLFIDGDHTYSGVKKDFLMYSPLVRRGGLIAFHDISSNSPDPDYGVSKIWKEINASYQFKEIIMDPNQAGIRHRSTLLRIMAKGFDGVARLELS